MRRRLSTDGKGAPTTISGIAESEAVVARVDWCEPSAKDLSPRTALTVIEATLGAPFIAAAWQVDRDDERWFVARGEHGAVVRSDRVGSKNRHGALEPWTSIRLPGKACSAVGTNRVLDLVAALGAHGGLKVARLDVALDDLTRSFTPRDFAERCVDGRLDDVDSLLRPGLVTRVRRRDAWDWSRREDGCFWLGSKGGARLLRVYDKGAESKGAIDAVRVELQTRNRAATTLGLDLLRARRTGEPLGRVMARHLVGFVDFREPDGSRSATAIWRRSAWWAEFVGGVQRATIAGAPRAPFETWEAGRGAQLRSFLEVQLRRRGASLDQLDRLRAGDTWACRVFCEVLAVIRGPGSVRLSARHEARLQEAQEADARGRK